MLIKTKPKLKTNEILCVVTLGWGGSEGGFARLLLIDGSSYPCLQGSLFGSSRQYVAHVLSQKTQGRACITYSRLVMIWIDLYWNSVTIARGCL